MIGDTYYERGEPVTVLVAWRNGGGLIPTKCNAEHNLPSPICTGLEMHGIADRSGPRNVLIQRRDGSLVVRPFRGLVTPETHRRQQARRRDKAAKSFRGNVT